MIKQGQDYFIAWCDQTEKEIMQKTSMLIAADLIFLFQKRI